MCKRVRGSKTTRLQSASSGSVALFGQQQEKRRERDLTNVTCYGCGKKGHLKRKCPEPSKQEPQDEKTVQDTSSTSKADASQSEGASMKKPPSETLYTAMATLGCVQTMDLRLGTTSIQGHPSISHPQESTCGRTGSSRNRWKYQWPTTGRFLLMALGIYGL